MAKEWRKKYRIKIDGVAMDYKEAAKHLGIKEITALARFHRYKTGSMTYESLTTRGKINIRHTATNTGSEEWRSLSGRRTPEERQANLDKIHIGSWERNFYRGEA